MNNQSFIADYQGKLLGVYSGNVKEDYFVEDFTDPKILTKFVVGTHDHEATFTQDGFEFLEKYYGLDNVIKLVTAEYPDYPFEKDLSPMDALLIKKQFAIPRAIYEKS